MDLYPSHHYVTYKPSSCSWFSKSTYANYFLKCHTYTRRPFTFLFYPICSSPDKPLVFLVSETVAGLVQIHYVVPQPCSKVLSSRLPSVHSPTSPWLYSHIIFSHTVFSQNPSSSLSAYSFKCFSGSAKSSFFSFFPCL